jgi:hypothetical protein
LWCRQRERNALGKPDTAKNASFALQQLCLYFYVPQIFQSIIWYLRYRNHGLAHPGRAELRKTSAIAIF